MLKSESSTSLMSSPSAEETLSMETFSFSSGGNSVGSDSLDLEDATYRKLLDDFPVGLWVWKYDEPLNNIRLVYANSVSDSFLR